MSGSQPVSGIGQLVFARLERNQSRRRREGFQTAGATDGFLGAGDLEEIEERLAFFTSAGRNLKQVFFSVPSGLLVVARIVAIPDRDASGRGGNYLAHALLIPPAMFASVDSNPFAFLDHAPFSESLPDALAAVEPSTGSLPPLAWQPTPGANSPRIDLTAETREAAAEFLFRNPVAPRKNPTNGANPSSNASERLELTGDEQRIAATLRAVWPLVPANWRPHCSFDTDFEGCNAAATRYWVTGQRGSDGGPRRDSSRREDNPTPYTTWVRWRIQDASALWTPQLRDAADRYCQLLGENAAVFPATDESLMSEIVTANRPLLRLLLVRGVRDAFRHHHIPSLRQRFDWCLRAWGRWLVPRWIVFLFSFFWNRRSRDELRSATADASDLTPLPEFANDVLAPLWASLADQCLASDSPATAFRLACGQETDGLRKRVAPRSVDEAPATRRWPDNQVTSSLRAAARQRRLPRHFEIREVIGRWVSRSDDRWLLVWFSGWSRGLAGGWLTGTWRRYGFRKLLSTLPVADRRDVVDALWRNDALGGGRSLRPAQAAKLRDRLLAE